jgi:hypothetical protein
MLNNIAALMNSAASVVGDYESIQTVTVGAGGQSSISFTSIPSTYKHLQVRCMYNTITNPDNIGMTLNGSVTSSRQHSLTGNGSSASASSTTDNWFTHQAGASSTIMYGMVIDLLDYSNTNKNKTARILGGGDFNGSGVMFFTSALYATTSAVTSFTLQGFGGQSFTQFASFALYGIR